MNTDFSQVEEEGKAISFHWTENICKSIVKDCVALLSVIHNFQRCKIAPKNLVQLPLCVYSRQYIAVPWNTSSLAVIIVHSDYGLNLLDKKAMFQKE